MQRSRSVVFLMGPTAAGKTELAISLARRHPFEIVSVDSTMVYRGLDIGSAKPGPLVLRQVPHHLIDICDPTERYSAARFREDALAAIAAIQSRSRIPLLVGGTGLYFRVLERGIAKLPAADAAVRARLELERASHGNLHMHQRLAAVDPEGARRIHPNDPQRTLRALEIWELTGQPMSYLQRRSVFAPMAFRALKIVVAAADRRRLRERVAWRFRRMLEQGLVNEVLGLKARGDLTLAAPALRAVGYRHVWRYLDGDIGYREMVAGAVTATCQLAKRQYTWLRSERDAQWFDSENSELLNEFEAFAAKRQILAKS